MELCCPYAQLSRELFRTQAVLARACRLFVMGRVIGPRIAPAVTPIIETAEERYVPMRRVGAKMAQWVDEHALGPGGPRTRTCIFYRRPATCTSSPPAGPWASRVLMNPTLAGCSTARLGIVMSL